MQDGKGYFQPSADEMHLVRRYAAQENQRILHIRKKISEVSSYIKHQGNDLEKNQISMDEYMGGGNDG